MFTVHRLFWIEYTFLYSVNKFLSCKKYSIQHFYFNELYIYLHFYITNANIIPITIKINEKYIRQSPFTLDIGVIIGYWNNPYLSTTRCFVWKTEFWYILNSPVFSSYFEPQEPKGSTQIFQLRLLILVSHLGKSPFLSLSPSVLFLLFLLFLLSWLSGQ